MGACGCGLRLCLRLRLRLRLNGALMPADVDCAMHGRWKKVFKKCQNFVKSYGPIGQKFERKVVVVCNESLG